MSDKAAEYVITADAAPFEGGISKAVTAAKNGSDQINKAMNDMGGMFKNVMGQINAFAGVLAGGEFFKEGIAATARLTGETGSLSKMLGVSMRDASTLNVALKSIGSSSDVYTDSLGKLLKQVRTGEAGVKAMGVATRGSNGELLNGQQLMDNAIGALKGYKEGTDRNLAAQALFGKGAAEVSALLKLNSTVMDEAEKKAEALGLVIGPEQAAKTKAYKESLNQVKMVIEGLLNTVGQAAMPIFTEMAKWFAETGPTAVGMFKAVFDEVGNLFQIVIDIAGELWADIKDVFNGVVQIINGAVNGDIAKDFDFWGSLMTVVQVAALGLKNGIVIALEVIRGAILGVMEVMKMYAAVAVAAMHLDWAGVKSAWSEGVKNVEKVVSDSQDRIVEKSAKTAEQMQAALMGSGAKAKEGAPKASTGKSFTGEAAPTDTKEVSNSFKAQAAVMKAELEGQLAIQKEYLTEAQEAYSDAYKHNLLTEIQYFAAKQAIEQQGFKGAIAIKEEELHQILALEAKAKSSGKQSDVLGLKAQELKITAELTVLNAQAFNVEIKNTRELNDALQQKKFAMMEIQRVSQQQVGSAEIDRERILIQQKKALNQISDAEEIQAEKGLQEQIYQIEMQALNDKEGQFDGNLEKIAANNAAKEQLERTHQTRMLKLDSDAEIVKRKNMTDMNKSIETGLQGVLKQAMMGSLTLKGLFKGVFSVITNAVTDMLAKTAIEWAKEALFGKAIKTATAISQITANAGIAGSAAFASIAAIPIVGPAMAPAAGLAAASGAMSFMSMVSASGGYDIPAGINPVVQTHAQEMILPAKHANVIREMADGGGAGGGDTHIHINATDAQSVKRLFENHGGALVAALRKQGRNFAT
jgi:hypothetical protein